MSNANASQIRKRTLRSLMKTLGMIKKTQNWIFKPIKYKDKIGLVPQINTLSVVFYEEQT